MENTIFTPAEEDAPIGEMENMYLNVDIGGDVYGIEIRYVLQIIGIQKINEMPEMPMYMCGFISFRDSVIPVASMRMRFGKPEEEYTDRTCIVVTQVGDRQIGLIVDGIRETLTIEPESISPQPTTGGDNPYVIGVARLGGGNTAVLIDIRKLFADNLF